MFDNAELEEVCERLDKVDNEEDLEEILLDLFGQLLPMETIRPQSSVYLSNDRGICFRLNENDIILTIQVQ